jgi:diguanylate cyclase (GGDEF)-like protein/PAS domain S-box-containing protein
VTERRTVENALKARESELATIMDNLPGMAFRCAYDDHWTLKFVSQGCRELTGYEPHELLDNNKVSLASLMDPEHEKLARQDVERAIATAEPYAHEYLLTRCNGETAWIWEKGRAVDVDGELMIEGIMLDISDRKAMEQALAQLAIRDSLTGLFNRRELEARLEEEVNRAHRYQRPVTLLWLDLDHFKSINDRYGHGRGDEALCQLSRVLEYSVRSVDVVGRYGGEEFAVILPETSVAGAVQVCERIREAIEQATVETGEAAIQYTISMGVAPANGNIPGYMAWLEQADKALYVAKESGRNQVRVYCGDDNV